LEERSNGKGKLAEASEEGQGPRRAVEPMMMRKSFGSMNKYISKAKSIIDFSKFVMICF
jgi:hypothetical protein